MQKVPQRSFDDRYPLEKPLHEEDTTHHLRDTTLTARHLIVIRNPCSMVFYERMGIHTS